MQLGGPTVDTLSYSARCRQVRALGGDFYDFMPLPHNRLALAVGDASGKGLAAALMISNVQSSLRTAASFTGYDGPAVLTAVSRQVYASSLEDRFATIFYGVFDAARRRLSMLMQATIPRWSFDETARSFGLEPVACPPGYFQIRPMRKGQFSSILAI
jgi:serine phosphatase RsbU (regulator of sigma subunit)